MTVGDVRIGGDEVIVMAGPCSAETEQQVMATAAAVRRAGAKILRGGAFKPRSSPYSLPGARRRRPAAAARRGEGREHGAGVRGDGHQPDRRSSSATATSSRSARATCRTSRCCASSGTRASRCCSKRGISATIEEWLLSAEYILSGGNTDVILCERGIRTFETATRNTFDVSAIPMVKKLSHLPVIADPSHGAGRRDMVAPMARAAVAAGADGLIIEVHCDPDHALSDGAQSMFPAQFDRLMAELRIIAPAIGRSICLEAASAPRVGSIAVQARSQR